MHPLHSSIPLEIVIAGALLLALAAAIWRVLRKRWRSGQRRAQWLRAAAAEDDAPRLLAARGYAIEGAQVRRSYQLIVDGRPTVISLRADFLVSRDGRIFVAEVKSGKRAPLVETAATRRQLLEYLVAFQAAGVLLVDGEAGQVRQIVFPDRELAPPALHWAGWGWLSCILLTLAALAWTWARR